MFINNNLSTQKLINNLFKNGEIIFEYYNFSNEEENQIIEFLEVCLKEIGKESIFNYLKFCFKELLGNAKKANIKRLYFLDKKLNIAENKIKNAKKFNSIEEAFLVVQHNKEGAGLGIIIIILMLKELGLSSDNFSITNNNDETEVFIKIPL